MIETPIKTGIVWEMRRNIKFHMLEVSSLGGIEGITQSITQQIERKDRNHDRQPRIDNKPGCGTVVGSSLLDHAAPTWSRRLHADTQIAEAGFQHHIGC